MNFSRFTKTLLDIFSLYFFTFLTYLITLAKIKIKDT